MTDDESELSRAEGDAAAEARTAADAAAEAGNDPTSAEYSVAFSPRNVAVGLAIVAGLIAVVAARRRRSRDTDGA